MRRLLTPRELLELRVRENADGCWEWLQARNADGYGRWVVDGREWKAHRKAYEIYRGPIPAGLEIDHLCRNRACCNPAHMEPVIHKTNVQRGFSPTAENRRKTHCDRGHEFTADNTYAKPSGGRECLICRRANHEAWKDAHPERIRELNRDAMRRHRGFADKRNLYCKNGHERTPENTQVAGGRRRCLVCSREWAREAMRAKRAAAKGATS